MDSAPLLILSIKNRYAQLNPALRQIADYLIANYDKVVDLGIGEIAAESGVSSSSVTRFIKTLGFKSFKSFQLELAKSLNTAAAPAAQGAGENRITFEYGGASARDTVEEICRKVFTSNLQMLSDTMQTLNYALIDHVSSLIMQARNVIFLGVGRSHVTAESGRIRLYRLGINCFCYADAHEQVVAASLAEERDVFIGISNYGRSASVVGNMALARRRGAATVGITSAEGSPLCQAAEHIFLTAYNCDNMEYRRQNGSYEPACENITQIALLDCIYMNVALKLDKRCMDNFYLTVKELEKERI